MKGFSSSLLFLTLFLASVSCVLVSTDQSALITLYNSLSQKGTLSWTTTQDLCNVTACGTATESFIPTVVCDSSVPQRVVQLHLYRKGLSGTISTAIGQLTSLTHLYLMRNSLSGAFPAASQLTNLVAINLELNSFSGTIPTFLGALSQLNQLNLESNSFIGPIPTELGSLSNLEILALSNNNIQSSLPTELGNLSSLTILTASGAQLTGSIPSSLGSISNLQQLNLGSNSLSGQIPSELGDIGGLFELNLRNNSLGGSLPAELGNLINLVTLDVSTNTFSGSIPDALSSLENIDSIDCGANQLSGSIPTSLGNFPYITKLNLNSNSLSGSIPTELGALVFLDSLNLGSNDLTGSIPSELGNLLSVTEVNLGANSLTGSIPENFANLQSLSSLNLAENGLSGTVPASLTSVSRFSKLILTGSNSFCPLVDYSQSGAVTDYQQQDCSACSPVPCYNNGVCRYVNSTFTCSCPVGYNGTNCQDVITCPALNESNAEWASSMPLNTVNGTCQTGYYGNPTRVCLSTGNWGFISNPCKLLCLSETYSRAVWPSTLPSVMATGVCTSGWTGSPLRRCNSTGYWETLVQNQCTRITCAAEFYNYVQWNVTSSNTIVNLNCPSGFSGRPSRTCQATGVWTNATNPCVPPFCASEVYQNASWSFSQTAANVTGTCLSGFYGSPVRLCTSNGWDSAVSKPCTGYTCPAEQSGFISWPQTSSLTTVNITCPTGYSGNSSRTCNATGSWQAILNPCVAIPACPAESLNSIWWNATYENSVAVGICALGDSGQPQRACLSGGSWNSTVVGSCTRNSCPSQAEVPITWPQTLSQITVSLSCPSGYLGSPSRLCQADGTWATTLNPCTPQPLCPNQTLNGIFWQEALGTKVVVGVCPNGWAGSPTRICFSSGDWSSAVTGSCTQNTCTAETSGFVAWPATLSLTNATLPCPNGYLGNPSRFCNSQGSWESIVDPCVLIPSCPLDIVDVITFPATRENQTQVLSCPLGYTGVVSRLCNLGGTWANPLGSCTRNTCPSQQEGNNTWPLTLSFATVSLSCLPGFSGSSFRTCQANGTWTVTTSNCTQLFCASETYSSATWLSTAALQNASGTCQTGYSGSPSRLCQQNGTWSTTVSNACTRNRCNLETYQNATWSTTNSLTTATGTCLTGYSGSPTRSCLASGTWNTTVVSPCLKQCPAATDYAHANWTFTNPNATANGTCVAGYSGAPFRKCLAAGTWDSLVQNQCTRNVCPAEYFNFVNWPQTLSLNSVVLSCPTGYTGRPYRICGASGVWGTISNPCVCSSNC